MVLSEGKRKWWFEEVTEVKQKQVKEREAA